MTSTDVNKCFLSPKTDFCMMEKSHKLTLKMVPYMFLRIRMLLKFEDALLPTNTLETKHLLKPV